MWASNSKFNALGRRNGNELFAVAVDRDKSSQNALKWAVDNLLGKGQTVILIHVVPRSSSAPAGNPDDETYKQQLLDQTKDLFLLFHCYCSRKDIRCLDVPLEDTSIGKALAEYVAHAAINNLILGSSRHGFIKRLKSVDVPTAVLKASPDFCTIYVISKTKISSVRNASRVAPFTSPLREQINYLHSNHSSTSDDSDSRSSRAKSTYTIREKPDFKGKSTPPSGNFYTNSQDGFDSNRPSITNGFGGKPYGDWYEAESDISFIGSNKGSTDRLHEMGGRTSRVSCSSDGSYDSGITGSKESDFSYTNDQFSNMSSGSQEEGEEMDKFKMELFKAMNLYTAAMKESKKTVALQRWRREEENKARDSNSPYISCINGDEEKNNKNVKVKIETDAIRRLENIEKQHRINAEKLERRGQFDHCDFRYRRYTIEDIEKSTDFFNIAHKIGEGGYGPVFRCSLDHTTVAVKVLRPDTNQGKSQFHQEVEVLSCIRHPNIVLLLGACPEYGCLVYEYLSNGSLEDRLKLRGNTPALSWQQRFRIITEVATGLLFLHRTKPEPIVHRDLKPGNILLDYNFVSKISDVGLARLVPSSKNDEVTQYRMTSAAGTFCYIDPEYQQTGMLGVKSDIYSLGIILLQVLTGKGAMGISHIVQESIENNTFPRVLDPNVPDWPIEDALRLAKLSLQCAELRRRDRPDLGKVILPELCRLRDLALQNSA